MNGNLPASHPSVDYYDSDYPGVGTSVHAENLDEVLDKQGLAHDIERYLGLARATSDQVLELCCGTGRVAIPLARAGIAVVGVDISAAMLNRFRQKIEQEPQPVRERLELVVQDIARLDLGSQRFELAILGFNSLLLLTERREQVVPRRLGVGVVAASARQLERPRVVGPGVAFGALVHQDRLDAGAEQEGGLRTDVDSSFEDGSRRRGRLVLRRRYGGKPRDCR